jgi:hypothetical protein
MTVLAALGRAAAGCPACPPRRCPPSPRRGRGRCREAKPTARASAGGVRRNRMTPRPYVPIQSPPAALTQDRTLTPSMSPGWRRIAGETSSRRKPEMEPIHSVPSAASRSARIQRCRRGLAERCTSAGRPRGSAVHPPTRRRPGGPARSSARSGRERRRGRRAPATHRSCGTGRRRSRPRASGPGPRRSRARTR